MKNFFLQPLLVPFGTGGPTPEEVSRTNGELEDSRFVVLSLEAGDGPGVLAGHPAFEEFLDAHPDTVLEPAWAKVDNAARAGRTTAPSKPSSG